MDIPPPLDIKTTWGNF